MTHNVAYGEFGIPLVLVRPARGRAPLPDTFAAFARAHRAGTRPLCCGSMELPSGPQLTASFARSFGASGLTPESRATCSIRRSSNRLSGSCKTGNEVVVIIDRAECLESPILTFTGLSLETSCRMNGSRFLVRIVLVGHPSIRRRLTYKSRRATPESNCLGCATLGPVDADDVARS